MRNQIIFRSKITKHIRWKDGNSTGNSEITTSLLLTRDWSKCWSWSQSSALWQSSSVELHYSVAVFWKLFSPAYLYGNYDSQFSTAILCDGNWWFEFILSLNAEDFNPLFAAAAVLEYLIRLCVACWCSQSIKLLLCCCCNAHYAARHVTVICHTWLPHLIMEKLRRTFWAFSCPESLTLSDWCKMN